MLKKAIFATALALGFVTSFHFAKGEETLRAAGEKLLEIRRRGS